MIGVITEDNIYPLLLDIAYTKKVNIYWYKSNDLKTGVEKLKERNCNIIITDQDSTIIKDSSIKFINIITRNIINMFCINIFINRICFSININSINIDIFISNCTKF